MALEEKEAHPGNGDLVQRLADRLSGVAHVRSVFGDPVEREGTTVIPVASIRYGFGGGGGRRPRRDQEGTGGGGGVRISPVGYIEMTGGDVAFRRIRSLSPLARALGVAVGLSIVARGLAAAVLPLLRRRRLRSLLAAVQPPRQRGPLGRRLQSVAR